MSHLCRECKNFPGLGNQCEISQKLMATANNPACSMFTSKSEVEVIPKGQPLFPDTKNIEIIKKGPTGQEQVICQQPKGTQEAISYVMAVDILKNVDKEKCPYSYRYV